MPINQYLSSQMLVITNGKLADQLVPCPQKHTDVKSIVIRLFLTKRTHTDFIKLKPIMDTTQQPLALILIFKLETHCDIRNLIGKCKNIIKNKPKSTMCQKKTFRNKNKNPKVFDIRLASAWNRTPRTRIKVHIILVVVAL
ncbi:Hypothetical predicted protein [Octopus vulgaris]|uniref:Uncharacterized protein n=1 Tax=Octopus vulgaris TaxID=6645 RepID=A0AA36AVD8_OCTVU|nr:Hypothetical predicted protein [Octopus vulgaris]